ncbi:MAG: 30S ribosomal protein S13 [Methanomassiliicoccales archaeon]|nr:30S ribosomal protein S13 [Methanomassiliicoccales archaeon]
MAEEGEPRKEEKKGEHPKDEYKEPKKEKKGGRKDESKEGKKEEGEKKKRVEPKKDEVKHDENFKYIVRLVNTDVDGEKPTVIGLQSVKGVGSRVAEIIVNRAGVGRVSKIGDLPDDKIEELEKLIIGYSDYAPTWAMNRQLDLETGDDMHIVGVDLDVRRKDDINLMKMIRSYKGVRHEDGQKVRGQRTRSNGRTGLTLGVMRARLLQGAAPAEGGAPAAAAEKPAEEKKPLTGGKGATAAKPAAAAPAAKPAEAKK